MTGVAPLPVNGAVFLDRRDAGRSLRVTHHPELGVTVVSLWRSDTCVGTVQLSPDDLRHLLHVLIDGVEVAAAPTTSSASA